MSTATDRPDRDCLDDAGAVERRAAAFARELGAVGDLGRLLAKRAAVLAGRMEFLAERDQLLVAAGVEAARDAFDADRRAERAGWAADLEGDDADRVAEALTGLELSAPGLDLLHRLWGRVLAGVRAGDPTATGRARGWITATGMGWEPSGDAAGLAAQVEAELARLRRRDERARPALEKIAADARREAGLAAAFDPSPEATAARKHEAAAERSFFRALKLIRDLRRDAGLAPVAAAEAELHAPLPAPDPAPAPAQPPARTSTLAAELGSFPPPAGSGSFRLDLVTLAPATPEPGPLDSFSVGAGTAHRDRLDLAAAGGERR